MLFDAPLPPVAAILLVVNSYLLAGIAVGVALSGCDSKGRSPAADASLGGAADAGADAFPPPRNDPGPGVSSQPFDATFMTPAGVFDAHYVFAEVVGGDCNPPFWNLMFTTTENGEQPSVILYIVMPPYAGVEVSGTMPASASFSSSQPLVTHTTHNATLDATRIDYPGDGAPRIIGHFLVTEPAWTIDVDLDALGLSAACI